MREALPLYDRLQEEVVLARAGVDASRVLDLGAGTGETSRRYLDARPDVQVVAVDASRAMLEVAAGVLGAGAELRLGRLEDPLPEGRFDLIVSALAVHHLDGLGRPISLSGSPSGSLRGRFVVGDVVLTNAPVAHPAPLDTTVDFPDRVDDLLEWLHQAQLQPVVRWSEGDLVVIAAQDCG